MSAAPTGIEGRKPSGPRQWSECTGVGEAAAGEGCHQLSPYNDMSIPAMTINRAAFRGWGFVEWCTAADAERARVLREEADRG